MYENTNSQWLDLVWDNPRMVQTKYKSMSLSVKITMLVNSQEPNHYIAALLSVTHSVMHEVLAFLCSAVM